MEFFVEMIQKYIKISGFNQNGQKYYLLGHSLGGMITSHYALKYESEIEKLILMSPVGIPEAPGMFKRDQFIWQRKQIMARYEQLCKRLDLQQISQQQQSSVTDTAQFHTYDQRQERVGEMVPGGD